MTQLATLLQRVRRTGEKLEPSRLMEILREDRYTGPVVLHFQDGIPRRAVPLDKDAGVDLQRAT